MTSRLKITYEKEIIKTIKKFEEDQIIKMYQSSSDKREFNLVLAH